MAAGEPARGPDDSEELVGAYEQLRACALAGDGQGWRLGLALVHRQGLAGWIRAVDGLPAPSAAPAAPPAGSLAPVDEPLVVILASMALACVPGG